MTTKPVDRDSRGELSIATDALANLVFSLILNREVELVALVRRGFRGKKSWLLFNAARAEAPDLGQIRGCAWWIAEGEPATMQQASSPLGRGLAQPSDCQLSLQGSKSSTRNATE
jgi:hypothetical protein